MLVLSRKRNESIVIGDNVVITIVDIRGDKVRLGIEAPPAISVHRREVYEEIKRLANQQPAPAAKPVEPEHGQIIEPTGSTEQRRECSEGG